MSKVTRFEDLVAWQRARALAADIYRACESSFRRDFVLRDQVWSAAQEVMELGRTIALEEASIEKRHRLRLPKLSTQHSALSTHLRAPCF